LTKDYKAGIVEVGYFANGRKKSKAITGGSTMSVESKEWSKIGDGSQDRVTIKYSDGSSRTVDERKDGGLTVTDTDRNGNSVSGEGGRGGLLGTMSGASRLNNTPGKL